MWSCLGVVLFLTVGVLASFESNEPPLGEGAEVLNNTNVVDKPQRSKRQQVIIAPKWDVSQPIPYFFKYENEAWRENIRRSLQLLSDETCIDFQENGTSPYYITFVYTDKGNCWSNLGPNMTSGARDVMIAEGCQDYVIHEMIHALGVEHEQRRSDQSLYVDIVWSNINESDYEWFRAMSPVNSSNKDLPYDLGSIMHYDSTAFHKIGGSDNTTILAKNPYYQETMGRRDTPSFKDVALINRMYCADHCPQPLSCERFGYPAPRACSSCKCTPGFAGRNCESMAPHTDPSCGDLTLVAEKVPKTLSSPANQIPNSDCNWNIRTTSGASVSLTVTVPNAEGYSWPGTCKSFIEIKTDLQTSNGAIATGPRLCKPGNYTFTSVSDELLVLYHVEEQVPYGYPGFTLTYAEA